MMRRTMACSLATLLLVVFAASAQTTAQSCYNVCDFGAAGDGKTLDSPAIQRTIEAAAQAGGGTVLIPAGEYLAVTIYLRSHITLQLEAGATLIAADIQQVGAAYDPPEPNEWDMYQDFGHSHWHNSLICGENLENIAIVGQGRIWGKDLCRSDKVPEGVGNKSIALKLCRNVTLRDISIRQAGHFGVLATGVDNLTIDNLRIDTNRDGMNVDCCRNVRISNCTVNSPRDDAICLKSSFALGYPRTTENVTITNCQVTGYAMGTLLDGVADPSEAQRRYDNPSGRIKFGTESNGGFRNIAISNCVMERSRGIALETVDGGLLEDVVITNISMRQASNAPFFLRLGSRMRGPDGVPVGKLRRIRISNVVVDGTLSDLPAIISGIPGHEIEDVTLENIRIHYRGGGTPQADLAPPELEAAYPESVMFGPLPAYGFYIRHVRGLELRNVRISCEEPDTRPAFVLQDVHGARFDHVEAQLAPDTPLCQLDQVTDFVNEPAGTPQP